MILTSSKYITFNDLIECPRCKALAKDFVLVKTETRDVRSVDHLIQSELKEIFCAHCKLRVLQITGVGEVLENYSSLDSPARFGT